MAGRTQAQIKVSELTAAKMMLKGCFTLEQIAKAVNKELPAGAHYTAKNIADMLARVRKRWADARLFSFTEELNKQLDRLDLIEEECWAAWERSKQPKTIRKQTGKHKGAPVLDTEGKVQFDNAGFVVREQSDQGYSLSEETKPGDPAFLDRISWCVAERNRMCGFYSKVSDAELDKLIADELRRIAELQQQQQHGAPLLNPAPARAHNLIEAEFQTIDAD